MTPESSCQFPSDDVPAPTGTGWVRVDLAALAANYRFLARSAAPSRCAATVKANAYGLGLAPVVRTLAAEGCRTFFVANVEEGMVVRDLLPRASVYVFNGVLAHNAPAMVAAELVPVLNDSAQVACWRAQAAARGRALPCALHVDTGMNRLGLGAEELHALTAVHGWHRGLDVRLVMTHLASAHRCDDPLTARQVADFARLRQRLPEAPTSIGNSAGTLLGAATRGDLVRPGIALYGGNPFDDAPNPMREVARVRGRIIQLREVGEQTSVGYGGAWQAPRGARLATVSVGYADGYRRALGMRAVAGVAGRRVPVVGRVSMDLLTLDVSDVHARQLTPGTPVDLIGGLVPLEEVARAADTIGYELLTGLGPRLQRLYTGGAGTTSTGTAGTASEGTAGTASEGAAGHT